MVNFETATLVLEVPVIDAEIKLSDLDFAPTSTCCHYWLIDKPNGPFSHGVCKYCHEEKDFSNSPPQYSTRNGMKKSFDPPNRRQLIGGYRNQMNQMI